MWREGKGREGTKLVLNRSILEVVVLFCAHPHIPVVPTCQAEDEVGMLCVLSTTKIGYLERGVLVVFSLP